MVLLWFGYCFLMCYVILYNSAAAECSAGEEAQRTSVVNVYYINVTGSSLLIFCYGCEIFAVGRIVKELFCNSTVQAVQTVWSKHCSYLVDSNCVELQSKACG